MSQLTVMDRNAAADPDRFITRSAAILRCVSGSEPDDSSDSHRKFHANHASNLQELRSSVPSC
jgi:hypothetical protein